MLFVWVGSKEGEHVWCLMLHFSVGSTRVFSIGYMLAYWNFKATKEIDYFSVVSGFL